MKKLTLYCGWIAMLGCCCAKDATRYGEYVDPFVGAAKYGHCMPGACIPFGLIQVGPESGNCSWDYTAGYQYADTSLNGFSQTRLNGTGCPSLGDLLFFPFGGAVERQTYQSAYQKENQHASPGYYSVVLSDFDILCEMTAAGHTALHRYTFKGSEKPHLLIDFQSGMVENKEKFYTFVLDAAQNFESPTLITGFSCADHWIKRTYYYSIEFSKPYTINRKLPLRDPREKASRYVLDFDLKTGETLMIKVGLSAVSIENARKNAAAEIKGWEFDDVKSQAQSEWEKVLSRIEAQGTTEQKRIFYTSMYHLFIHPNNIADAGEKPFYSTLSLWDTYRAAHPLYTLVADDKVNDFINSMLHQYDQQGFLPIWALWGGETYCMIGNHAVPVIVDAYLKGYRGFDAEKAFLAIKTTLNKKLPKSDWKTYDQYGYYPFDIVPQESVSRTLESCYDDYCAAQLAKALGKTEDYEFFMKRSRYYQNLFDPETKLMRPKDSKGQWKTPFDTLVISHAGTAGGDYTEGNAWQYTWHVQHDVDGLISLLGGADVFTSKLDMLFFIEQEARNKGFSLDVTGLIGQYAHGNEPSHHVAYLYALAGKPCKTAELVNQICKTKYQDNVDGLCGNDDCGQMSAWYIFSTMGFYPVNPCGGDYVLGAPQLPGATIRLANGKSFTMETDNYGAKNIYVKSVELNGAKYDKKSIRHQDITAGSTLKFYMTDNCGTK
jgi:predicted alpha-1,2-mannosidase